jgi:hypothetical protein
MTASTTTAAPGAGCLLFSETFNGSTIARSALIGFYSTCLTGYNGTGPIPGSSNNIPGCLTNYTNAPVGFAQLNPNSVNKRGGLFLDAPFNSSDGLEVTADMVQYGGNGGDGMVLFFVNGTTTLTDLGGSGGALGYAQFVNGTPGITGAYMGVGFDAWGHYARVGLFCFQLPHSSQDTLSFPLPLHCRIGKEGEQAAPSCLRTTSTRRFPCRLSRSVDLETARLAIVGIPRTYYRQVVPTRGLYGAPLSLPACARCG